MADDAAEVEDTGTDPEPEAEVSEGADPSTDETTDVTDTGTDPVEAQPADEPEEYRKLLEKVGGDKGKVASEYWQAKNALKAAANEKRTLEARLKELEGRPRQPEKPERPPEPPQPHPDIKKLDERITALTQKGSEIEKSQRETLVSLSNATIERQVLERQLEQGGEYLSPESKSELKSELRSAKDREAALLEKFQNAEERKDLNQERLDRVQQEKDFASKHLEGAKARQEQAERELQSFNVEFPSAIDTTIKDICDELKVVEDDKVREFIWASAYRHLGWILAPFHGQGVSAADVDFEAVLREHIQNTTQIFDVIGRGAVGKLSQAKLKVSKPAGAAAPSGSTTTQNPAQPNDWRDSPAIVAARQRMARLG